ncbi:MULTISPECIES: vitamin B12 dependent-methionine synthase activation domain-containing protein [Atopobiaceae]|uniref:Vitamin B12 dependent methionine synthase, activation domain n=1 Tax=Parafannyhessea umbonata TaxID=604330 RepID=A0A1H6HTN6_9ACTN|nr:MULTISPECIES: vitamin B12 dependent-methionine synthase activation domain-containing protein [Atopobiaceae]SEH37500.1 Vitamin B12 dependent methionine synthase, activation domain [Parafannyhessea umbonata]SJZ39707.1 Vitamin B12 dependent methionine synthase, activation domain [Olsenella sp. KH1P3]
MLESYEIDLVDRTEVLRYLGYRGQDVTPELDARLDEEIDHCIRTSRPQASLRVFDVESRSQREDGTHVVHLAGSPLELAGESMREHLDSAVKVGAFAVTIGMGVERELRRLSLTNHLDQLLFDAAATALVERAADAAEASLIARAHEFGLFTNYRFSPGYGDLPMETQPPLLRELGGERLGITLSPTLLMTPTKSVTAVVGMFEQRQSSTRASCAHCPCHDFCKIRPTGRTCRG